MTLTDLIPGVAQGKLILAGVALAAFAVPTIGWTVTAHTLKARTAALAVAKQADDNEVASHNITLASLAECQSVNASLNAQSDARAKAYADSKTADAANATRNDKLEASTAPARAALDAIAKQSGGSVPCRVPDVVAANLGGL